jgi:hypothetical protein
MMEKGVNQEERPLKVALDTTHVHWLYYHQEGNENNSHY